LKRLFPLAAIEIFVWLILLVIILIISKVAFLINFGTGTTIQLIVTEVSRVLASGVLVLIWLMSWKKVADIYLRKELSREKTTV
jgi:glucan phosphoethanolaminetransferase (alkaline phosphatase superfamily)